MQWQDFAQQHTDAVTLWLTDFLKQQPRLPGPLSDAMQYSLFAGGKRVRPLLTLATGRALNVSVDKLMPCAAAIECIHTYSLIHDDLPSMDDDDLRRGKPTCHVKFDEATAVLAGDALQTLAFEIISSAEVLSDGEKVKIFSILSKASGFSGMCGGQSVDLFHTGKRVSQQEMELMHRLKTGALIDASVQMSCVLANTEETSSAHFRRFSQAIGLGFQVKDDILDIEGDTESLGKPKGSDEKSNKSTYPVLMGLEGARIYLQQLHQEALQALQSIPYNVELLASFTDYLFNRTH